MHLSWPGCDGNEHQDKQDEACREGNACLWIVLLHARDVCSRCMLPGPGVGTIVRAMSTYLDGCQSKFVLQGGS